MTHEEILREVASLPPEGQRQVVDFIAFLHQRYGRLSRTEKSETSVILPDCNHGEIKNY